MEHASGIGLKSFPRPSVAVVFGAGGGIGSALAEALRSAARFEQVIGFSRGSSPSINLLDEASLERAASFVSTKYDVRLVINTTGFLHDEQQGPEKIWRHLDAARLARAFALNDIGPALIMKAYASPLAAHWQGCFRDAVRQGWEYRRQPARRLVCLPRVEGGPAPTGADRGRGTGTPGPRNFVSRCIPARSPHRYPPRSRRLASRSMLPRRQRAICSRSSMA